MSTHSDAQTVALAQGGDTATRVTLPPLEPGTRFGSYRILGLLGEGGMGQVYQAVQGTLERLVALKVMRPELAADPQFTERFLREARAAASICHQNVVVIFDAGSCDGRLYMAFQFVSGGDLDVALARRGTLAPAEALLLIAGCCDGLQAIHEAGLVHRDIKPHNIFLDEKGRPKLGDFGLARQAQGADRMTLTGVGMGTPAYMAPEQAQGLADIDIRADIHALGGTLFTLLTGKPPFGGLTPWMVVNAVCNEPAPDPRSLVPTLPEPVAAIVLRCLAKRRDDRYATPTALRTDLLRVHAALTGGLATTGAALPALPQVISASLLRRISVPFGLTAAALMALPLVLRPLLQINDHYRAAAWNDSGWWAGLLSALLTSTCVLTAQVSDTRHRLIQLVPVVAGSAACGLAVWFLGRAFLTVGEASGSGWESVVAIATWAAALGCAGWHASRWWHQDPALAGRAYPRALGALLIALLVTTVCHLTVASRPLKTTIKDESKSAWNSLKSTFSDHEGTNTVSEPRATGAAQALAWLAPLTVLLIAPALLGWRERRRLTEY